MYMVLYEMINKLKIVYMDIKLDNRNFQLISRFRVRE